MALSYSARLSVIQRVYSRLIRIRNEIPKMACHLWLTRCLHNQYLSTQILRFTSRGYSGLPVSVVVSKLKMAGDSRSA